MIHLYLFNEGNKASAYGIGTYIQQMKEMLKGETGIQLTVIEFMSDKQEVLVENIDFYQTISFPQVKIPPLVNYQEKYFRNIWYVLRRYMRHTEEDRIIFHLNYKQEYAMLAYMKRDYPQCRVIFAVHYQDWCFPLNGNTSWLRKIIEKEKGALVEQKEIDAYEHFEEERRIYEAVDYIVCLAHYTSDLLKNIYKISEDKIITIYNGLKNNGVLLQYQDKRILKKSLGFSVNTPIILFVGRLDSMKGLGSLIESYQKVLIQKPDSRLVIVGSGNLEKYMFMAKDSCGKITFTGRLEKEDVYRFYQIADVGVVPSMHEQCSYVVIEMMMFGLPIVASDAGGLKEMMEDLVVGDIVPVEKKESEVIISSALLAEKILKILSHKNSEKERIHTIFMNKYELFVMKKKYLKFYKSRF